MRVRHLHQHVPQSPSLRRKYPHGLPTKIALWVRTSKGLKVLVSFILASALPAGTRALAGTTAALLKYVPFRTATGQAFGLTQDEYITQLSRNFVPRPLTQAQVYMYAPMVEMSQAEIRADTPWVYIADPDAGNTVQFDL